MNGRAGGKSCYAGQYTELKCMGRGRFGTAYLVRNKLDKKLYVAKKIALEGLGDKEVEGAFNEANLLKNLSHPNVVSYKNSFNEKTTLIIAMEYCDRGDLASVIQKRKQANANFTEKEIMHWFVQICLALKHIHGLRILHRDIKASNIFLTATNCVKLGDFGISKVLQGTLEAAMTVVGTPYYMSPEVYQNKPYTLKSDVWALGCLLYELCTFQHPFVADNLLSLGYKIAKEQYEPLPPCYSQELANLVTAMLLKDDQVRPSMSEILASSIVQRHMGILIQANSLPPKKPTAGPFEIVAAATAAAKPEEMKEKPVISARESLKQRKEAETQRKFEEMKQATKAAYLQIAITKQRKQEELYSNNLSPSSNEKKRFSSPSTIFEVASKPLTISPVQDFTQTAFGETTKRVSSLQSSRSDDGRARVPPKSEPVTAGTVKATPEIADTRVIKSIGRYDVDGELAAEEYPEDFVIFGLSEPLGRGYRG